MIAVGADIAAEYYFSILLDRSNRRHLAMCSREGGMDIETLAKERPEALARVPLAPVVGIDAEVARRIATEAGFDEATAQAIAPVLETLWAVYRDEDATLVEVNPLVSSPDGSVWAVDGKVTLDDNARFRHPGHAELVDVATQDPREAAAKAAGLNYVRLEGQVGVIGNGAGLVMSTLDVVAMAGEEFGGMKPANFLDIGGGARLRSWLRAWTSSSAMSRFVPCSSMFSAASLPATRSLAASSGALETLGGCGIQAVGRAPRWQQGRGRARDPRAGRAPARPHGRNDGWGGPARSRARSPGAVEVTTREPQENTHDYLRQL